MPPALGAASGDLIQGKHRSEVPLGEGGSAASRMERVYDVTVVTGDLRGGGTTSRVFVTLFGEVGASREEMLDGDKDSFTRGKTDRWAGWVVCLWVEGIEAW